MFRSCLLVGLGAWLVAVLIARIAHLGQHEFLGQPYLLVPVNLPSFYFLPLFAAGVYWLAKRQNRVSSSVQLALLLSLAFTGGRFLYWWNVARDLAENPDPGRMEAAAVGQSIGGLLIGALGFGSYVALAVALWQVVFRDRGLSPPDIPSLPTSGVSGHGGSTNQ